MVNSENYVDDEFDGINRSYAEVVQENIPVSGTDHEGIQTASNMDGQTNSVYDLEQSNQISGDHEHASRATAWSMGAPVSGRSNDGPAVVQQTFVDPVYRFTASEQPRRVPYTEQSNDGAAHDHLNLASNTNQRISYWNINETDRVSPVNQVDARHANIVDRLNQSRQSNSLPYDAASEITNDTITNTHDVQGSVSGISVRTSARNADRRVGRPESSREQNKSPVIHSLDDKDDDDDDDFTDCIRKRTKRFYVGGFNANVSPEKIMRYVN